MFLRFFFLHVTLFLRPLLPWNRSGMSLVLPFCCSAMIKFLEGVQLTTARGGERETPGLMGGFSELTQHQLGKRRVGRISKEEKREALKRAVVFWCLSIGAVCRTHFLSGGLPHSPSWSILSWDYSQVS